MSDASRVFISYRRDDSAGHAGRLYDALVSRFGQESVFMDVDEIGPGADFADVIEDAVGRCDVLVALIGKTWLTTRNADGSRRLDDARDVVRLEIETALGQAVRVIPVLVQGAVPPTADELPGAIADVARRNAIELSDSRWHYDVVRLLEAIAAGE